MIFQCYKSFWVFTFGWLFIFLNIYRGKPPYVFTYWGILGCAAWIPSGLGTIASVPRLGVGMAIVINTGTSATLQFLVGQLSFIGETMKKHGTPGHEYVLAPFFLVGVIIGMTGLVLSPTMRCPERRRVRESSMTEHLSLPATDSRDIATGAGESVQQQDDNESTITKADLLIGLLCAFSAGCFSALQFAVITIGKRVEAGRLGVTTCNDSPLCTNEFDSFGSYMTSFGIGAGLLTPLYLSMYVATEKYQGRDLPPSHFHTLKILGSLAGWCWVAGNVFQSAAVNRGGSSVMGPANQAIQLITSGAWGLLFYREVKDPKRILCWVISAAWTVAFVILLGNEKAKAPSSTTTPMPTFLSTESFLFRQRQIR